MTTRASDASADGGLGRWGFPTSVEPFSTDDAETDPTMSGSEVELYAAVQSMMKLNGFELMRARRGSPSAPWEPAELVSELNSSAHDVTPRLTADGLALYLGSARAGTVGGQDVWRATRPSLTAPWSAPAHLDLPALNGAANDRAASPCLDEGRLVFASDRNGGDDLFELVGASATAISGASDPNTAESAPFITADCLTVYFASDRAGTFDLYVMTRPTPTSGFGAPVRIDELSTPADELDPWVSPDGRHIVFASNAAGNFDLLEASR
ncbi:MAG: PD40 domain-containing protein [Myxococcales bacterium]|nr:PD40 domain-containing protein [Myxococcales bacterium]